MASRPLLRSRRKRWLGGVCAGFAAWIGMPVLLVRLAWLVLTVIPVLPGLPLYLLLWVILPLEEAEHGAGDEAGEEATPTRTASCC